MARKKKGKVTDRDENKTTQDVKKKKSCLKQMWNETPEYSAQLPYFCVTVKPSIGNTTPLVFKQIKRKKSLM